MEETSHVMRVKMGNQDQDKTCMEDLPLDIALQIFTRLSMVSFICSKCVCKAWYKLACHPWIATNYGLNKNPCLITYFKKRPQDGLYFIEDDNGSYETGLIKKLRVPFLNRGCKIGFVLSCQGLLCLAYSQRRSEYIDRHVCIFNPFTSEFNHLPVPGPSIIGEKFNDVFGFGFDTKSKDYKVIRVVEDVSTCTDENKKARQKFQVFRLGTSDWRCVDNGSFLVSLKHPGASVNGFLHWLSKNHLEHERVVVSFSLQNEELGSFNLPFFSSQFFYLRSFVLRGCLFVSALDDSLCLHVWRMTGYGVEKSWAEEFSIKALLHPCFHGKNWLLSLLQNGEIMFLHTGSLCSYNIETGRITEIRKCLLSPAFKATAHVASLLSPFL